MKFDNLYKIMVNEALTDTPEMSEDNSALIGDPVSDALKAKYTPTEMFKAQQALELQTTDLTVAERRAYTKIAIGMGFIDQVSEGGKSADEALAEIEQLYAEYKMGTTETSKGFTSHRAEPVRGEERMSTDDARQYGVNPEIDEDPYTAGFED